MPKKSGLGRGLDALIPGDIHPTTDGIVQVPIDQIHPNPRQPRSNIHTTEIDELAASIAEHGLLQPLIVSYDATERVYTLVAGERRLLAARRAGMQTISVIIREVSDQQRLVLALIENVQRADLSPLETAEAYRQLAEDFNLSHEEIAQRVGKSRTTVTNTLRLLRLPASLQKALAEGAISEGHA